MVKRESLILDALDGIKDGDSDQFVPAYTDFAPPLRGILGLLPAHLPFVFDNISLRMMQSPSMYIRYSAKLEGYENEA